MQNIWYIIKMLYRIDKQYMFVSLITIPSNIVNPVIDIFLLQELLRQISEVKSIRNTVIVLITMFAINLVNYFWEGYYFQIYVPKHQTKISTKMKLIVLEKANKCDVKCFETPDFFNSYVIAAKEAQSRAIGVWDWIISIFSLISTLITIITLIIHTDAFLLIFACIGVLIGLLPRIINAKRSYEYANESENINREREYIDRTIYDISYIYDVKLSNVFSVFSGKLIRAAKKQIALTKKYGMKIMLTEMINSIINSISVLSTWMYLGVRIIKGYYTISSFTAMFNACNQFRNNMLSLSNLIPQFTSHKLFINNFRTFMEYCPEIDEDKSAEECTFERCISVKQMSFSYPGTEGYALKDINFNIKKGEKIAIVGRNGAGKSTLIKLLLRLYDPSEGSILIDEKDYRDVNVVSLRHKFSCLFQNFSLYSVSLGENIALDAAVSSDKIRHSLEKADISDLISRDNNLIHAQINRDFDPNGMILSGGQRQRIGISRLYYQNRDIMILDEANSALDPIAEKEINDLTFKAADGKTTIFISHRLSSAVNADRIFYMEDGQILEVGTHDELMNKGGKYAEMYHIQAEMYQK